MDLAADAESWTVLLVEPPEFRQEAVGQFRTDAASTQPLLAAPQGSAKKRPAISAHAGRAGISNALGGSAGFEVAQLRTREPGA